MKKPAPLRKEQLSPDYQAPSKESERLSGKREEVDGCLTTRASFTTSKRAGEARQDARPENGPSNIGYARSTTVGEKVVHPFLKPNNRVVGAIIPASAPNYERPLHLRPVHEKILGGHHSTIGLFVDQIELGIPQPLIILAALRYIGVDAYDLSS